MASVPMTLKWHREVRFNFRLCCSCITTLGKLFTPISRDADSLHYCVASLTNGLPQCWRTVLNCRPSAMQANGCWQLNSKSGCLIFSALLCCSGLFCMVLFSGLLCKSFFGCGCIKHSKTWKIIAMSIVLCVYYLLSCHISSAFCTWRHDKTCLV